ncbi:MAG: hypothetical protein K6A44_01740 [bacterium]|nr:hypothetical protein [bacterium]
MVNISQIRPKTVNMMRLFKKRLASPEQMQAILENIGDNERNLGSIPYDWFEKTLSTDERGSFASMVFDIFADFAASIRSAWFAPIPQQKISMLQQNLSEHVDKKATVEYLAEGAIGKAFKFNIKDKNYVLKIFHDVTGLDLEHGKNIEVANAISFCHGTKPSQRANFFFGKIAREKDKDGFMVTEFVPQGKNAKSISPTEMEYHRFYIFDDAKRNTVDGKRVDFGGIRLNYSSKEKEQLAKKFFPILERIDKKAIKKLLENERTASDFTDFLADFWDKYSTCGMFSDEYKKIMRLFESGVFE